MSRDEADGCDVLAQIMTVVVMVMVMVTATVRQHYVINGRELTDSLSPTMGPGPLWA